MTGYAVIIAPPSATVAADELRALMPQLRRRGPHGDSVFTDGAFGVASSLLDVGDRRLVPTWTRAGPFIVAGQIRVDARDALVEALHRAGAHASDADPDVQLFAQAWSVWSTDTPAHVLGDFSAVIYDRQSHVTTLVRDPFGVRMLFYHAGTERLVASNTLEAVLSAGVSRELDDDAIADFIAEGQNEDPATTTFREVRRVPPAHCLRIHQDGKQELHRYWELPRPSVDRSRSAETIVIRFRELLEASVHDRVRSPRLTVFMSGGVDSTTLAALAVRYVSEPANVLARTAHLPTLAPSDDTHRARIAAAAIGVPHVLIDVDEYGYREGTAHPIPSTPEPSDDPDLAALYDELRRASAHAPVAFWGEDPDAFLSPPHLVELLRGGSVPRVLVDVVTYAWRARARPHLAIRDLVRRRLRRTKPDAGVRSGPPWLRSDLRHRREERLRSRVETPHPTRSEAADRLEQWHWQPFLEALDAASHGHPVDVRLPYLDLRLIEFALAAPPIPWMQRKQLLREAARGLIPEAVRVAPKRGLPGVYSARVAQWWSREPAPFIPCAALARFVDVGAMPTVTRASSTNDVLAHMRLRLLDRWLRTNADH